VLCVGLPTKNPGQKTGTVLEFLKGETKRAGSKGVEIVDRDMARRKEEEEEGGGGIRNTKKNHYHGHEIIHLVMYTKKKLKKLWSSLSGRHEFMTKTANSQHKKNSSPWSSHGHEIMHLIALNPVSLETRAKFRFFGHFRKNRFRKICTAKSAARRFFFLFGKEAAMRSLGRINKTDVAARDSLGDTTAAPPSGKWIPAAFVPKSAQQPWEF